MGNQTHAVFTSDIIERAIVEEEKRVKKHRFIDWCQFQVTNCPIINRDGIDYSQLHNQLGRAMSAADLEQKLLRINRGFRFIQHPLKTDIKGLYIVRGQLSVELNPTPNLEYICAYHATVMPERSLMKTKIIEIPDPDYFTGRTPIERDKLPAHERVVDRDSPFGYGYAFDPDAPRPGFKYVEQGYGEERRGWRTVLLRLVVNNFVALVDIEREFGHDQRPEWAYWTGRRPTAEHVW